ncbi:aminopeptidase N [Niveibacterium umoris]|uniref:Aminopeptidase N n=1 Tax=Niveibacterium umoris TaxID=1193620 RepID=A0A840BNH2_9RHOO|nr:aminopeptidase N [Niveibacterium umoris]MBB4014124.1 aminopeptidase N [Niveibacterium umoris]
MRTDTPQAIYLKDYTPPAFQIETVDLDISIEAGFACVTASLACQRNPAAADPSASLVLNGEDLKLESVRLDGRPLGQGEYVLCADQLMIHAELPDSFTLTTVSTINPDGNTQLSGLYRSKDGYFTQCEAEGFRRITWFLDRPDVMAKYTVTIHADKAQFPVLLGNGNPVGAGDEEGGRHWAKWEDPFRKPSYLFAMVAAKLDMLEDWFVTKSGRKVRCAVYVEPGKLDQCGHAMAALKKSMKWDEDVFGLEMDLDHYMIVAVGDFNMGAMENKGLNIFNTKYVLARPDTATDIDFQNIDRVVAHEYFHNWTGNRVTCRDWFQLSLKEGLTVFRDQQFGMDMHSAGVTRIQEVRTLRTAQFPEDAGPMAHPIRPASYAEINNFYSATVYEKGAEVIRMIHTLIGKDAFRKGMDLYFARHDGQAVTCEDFVAAMQDASGLDLTQFKRWYNQAGTPKLLVRGAYDAATKRFTLDVEQQYPATAYEKRLEAEGRAVARGAYHLPLVIGLLGADGRELPLRLAGESAAADTQRVLSITEDRQQFVFEDLAEAPVPSLLRGFSAPVVLDYPYSQADLTHLMARDSDAFCRWEAGQRLATDILMAGVAAFQAGSGDTLAWVPAGYVDAMRALLGSAFAPGGDPALVAEALMLPSEVVLIEATEGTVDPDAIHAARLALRRHLANELKGPFAAAYHELKIDAPYSPEATQAGARALRNACLSYIAEVDDAESLALLQNQFDSANNMTDSMAALSALAQFASPARDAALERFLAKWKDEALVVDKWLQVQSTSRAPDTGARVRALLDHPAFDIRNPNKVYALIRAFCAANPKHFHAADGSGYALAADAILQLDALNPQVAARIARSFDRWRKFDTQRQSLARMALVRVQGHDKLSRDVAEIVGKALES